MEHLGLLGSPGVPVPIPVGLGAGRDLANVSPVNTEASKHAHRPMWSWRMGHALEQVKFAQEGYFFRLCQSMKVFSVLCMRHQNMFPCLLNVHIGVYMCQFFPS